MNVVRAPWTAWQVANLIRWQGDKGVHPFTCGNQHDEVMILVPTRAGWVCTACDWTQTWAHSLMTGEHAHPHLGAPVALPDPFLEDVWFCTQCRDLVAWDDLDMTWFEAGTQKCHMCAKANPYSAEARP